MNTVLELQVNGTYELDVVEIGPKGNDGLNGAAATIAVRNVTTLPAGSQATVTNAGTPSAALLDFGLPQGAAGTSASSGGSVATRADLKTGAAANAAIGELWQVTEEIYGGPFRMRAGQPPKSDPTQGYYVVVSSTKFYERQTEGGVPWREAWFLGASPLSRSGVLSLIESLKPDGADVRLSGGTRLWNNTQKAVVLQKPGHWRGTSRHRTTFNCDASFDRQAAGDSIFIVAGIDIHISDIGFKDFRSSANSGPPCPIIIRTANLTNDAEVNATSINVRDIEVDKLRFEDCDCGVRALYFFTGPANDVTGTTWWTPERIRIHHNDFIRQRYQSIVPECRGVEVYDNYMHHAVYSARPFEMAIRALGNDGVKIVRNTFILEQYMQAIGVMLAGTSNGQNNVAFRNCNDLTIESNTIRGGFIAVSEASGALFIRFNRMTLDPTYAGPNKTFAIRLGQSSTPTYFGSVIIEQNYMVGYKQPLWVINSSWKLIRYFKNEWHGDAFTGEDNFVTPLLFDLNFKTHDDQTGKTPALVDIDNNLFNGNPGARGFTITTSGLMQGCLFRIRNNLFPEVNGQPAYGLMAMHSSALVDVDGKTSVAGDTVTGTIFAGDNHRLPDGFYAKMMSNFRPEQITAPFPPTWS